MDSLSATCLHPAVADFWKTPLLPQEALDHRTKIWKVRFNRVPYDRQIHFQVAVRNGISHLVCRSQRKLRVRSSELWEQYLDRVTRLANYLNVSENHILPKHVG